MNAHGRMRSLIGEIYGAAADESGWPGVLEHLADEFQGGTAGFQYRAGADPTIRSATFVRLDPEVLRVYRTEFASRNPWVQRTQATLRPGDTIALEAVMPIAELLRTEYCDCVLRPAGVYHGFGACLARYGPDVQTFTVVRPLAQGPFQPAELSRVRALLPHLHRALQVNERLKALQRTRDALADGLEHLRHGVLLIDRRGHVVFANRAARAIVAQRDGLSIDADGLVASALADRMALRSLLDDATRTTTGEGFGSGGALRVRRPSQKRSFLVLVTPVSLTLDDDGASRLATVFISDPEANLDADTRVVRQTYGLTATEAHVVRAFAETASVDAAAEALGISRETMRWHLRHIFRKTGTHRQAVLLRRLLDGQPASPPVLPDDGPRPARR